MGKFFKFKLPLILIIGSVLVVVALVAWQKSQNDSDWLNRSQIAGRK